MKALTLHRPWPWAIFHLPADKAKRVENREWRPWPSVVGQVIAIHAGKTFDKYGLQAIEREILRADVADCPELHQEGIIGTARVVGCVEASWVAPPVGKIDSSWASKTPDQIIADTKEILFKQEQRKSPWFCGPFGWSLDEVRVLPRPVPCRGAQGLWNVPPEVEAEIKRQLEVR